MTTHIAPAAEGGRFEDRLSRHVEGMTSPPVYVLNGAPMTAVERYIGLTIAEARALLVLVHAARVTVRTRGGGALADALARLDEASPR